MTSSILAPCPSITDSDRGLASRLGVEWLACTGCAREYPVSAQAVCDFCFAPLEIVYDFALLKASLDRAQIEGGPRSLWRYAALLPVPADASHDKGVGYTPLRPAPRLAAELGIKKLWLKNDSQNPTNSFKDRAVAVALAVAKELGFSTVGCASTGNLANAVAGQAASWGLASVVLVPASLEVNKLVATSIYGGTLLAIDGSYDDVNRLCVELLDSNPWGFVNINLRAFYAEGSKTVAFEIAEQLGWRTPDAVVAPVASGCLFRKIAQGFGELSKVGLISENSSPAMFGAQAGGCSPVADAFEAGSSDILPVKPASRATSLAIGNPADGSEAIATARSSGGAINSCAEGSIEVAIRLLARTEGIFTEPAGGVTVAVLERLVSEGRIAPDQEVVAVITGSGLKTPEFVPPDNDRPVIPPRVGDVEDTLRRLT